MIKQIVFQPIGNKQGENNFNKTINGCIDLDELKEFLCDNQYKNLLEIYPDKQVKIWGVQSENNSAKKKENSKDNKSISPNVSKWNKLQKGARVLFYSDKSFCKAATVTYTIWNKKIAEHLWNLNECNETWECLYFVNDVKVVDLDADEVFELIGTKEKHVQGFRILKDEHAKKIIDQYGEVI